ncbi:MAG: type III-B CRISPR-associated protein Cas10/Cmr2 [Chloroflexi bacterium]|nr:MAG: type III-B CRISPR-associated protein Cas10/Cmr2 [Chloroflexota bacterium]
MAGLAERLSGVDLLKRSGRTAFDSHFPSTSHIAALPFLQRMMRIDAAGKQKLRAAWDVSIKKLDQLAVIPLKEQISQEYAAHPILDRHDGSLLFEGRLADVLALPSTDTTLNERLLQARDGQQTFYRSLDEQFRRIGLGEKRPSTYYALLQADGDSMGDFIDALAEHGYERHRELSQALSRFAESVRKVVNEDHQGALVYSGGDDVLAFLPLHTVLKCAVELKRRFHNALKGLGTRLGRRPPTLSVGIAIVHQLASLRDARYLAHDAEQQAKRAGKNALAITVSKRSGEDYRAVGNWGNIDVRLSQLMTYCRAASLPVGMAYELRDLVLRLSVPETDPQYDALQNVMRFDALRILMRKLTVPAGKLPPERVKEIDGFLRVQLDLPPQEQKGQHNMFQASSMVRSLAEQREIQRRPLVSLETFINELVIAQMLAEAAELAQPGEGVKL